MFKNHTTETTLTTVIAAAVVLAFLASLVA